MSNDKDFLEDVSFWNKKIRFNTPLKYSFFLLYLVYLLFVIFYLGLLNYYISTNQLLADFLFIVLFVFALIVGVKVPKSFQKLIINNKDIFKSEEISQKFLNYVSKSFRSKIEFYIPLLSALIIITMFLIFDIYFDIYPTIFGYPLFSRKSEYFEIESSLKDMFLFALILRCIFMFIGILIITSGLIIIMFLFKSLNFLNNKEKELLKEPLTYLDLRKGIFNKFISLLVIFILIPCILIAIFMFELKGFFNGRFYFYIMIIHFIMFIRYIGCLAK
ncbi:MAG: hypothetical protein ACFFDN_43555 [Candidatus Hodarchaeota archaeon]